MNPLVSIVVTGIGATALTDLWAIVRARAFGIATPDFGLVGRWIGHMPRGTFAHPSIKAAPPVRGERAIGWIAHYAIGIAFAALLPLAFGTGWLARPTLAPALLIGISTVAAPYFVMQPGMGAGIAASRTPDPASARMHSFLTHLVFGAGLYAAAIALTSVA